MTQATEIDTRLELIKKISLQFRSRCGGLWLDKRILLLKELLAELENGGEGGIKQTK